MIIIINTPIQFSFWTILKISQIDNGIYFHLKAKAIFQYAKLGSYFDTNDRISFEDIINYKF